MTKLIKYIYNPLEKEDFLLTISFINKYSCYNFIDGGEK